MYQAARHFPASPQSLFVKDPTPGREASVRVGGGVCDSSIVDRLQTAAVDPTLMVAAGSKLVVQEISVAVRPSTRTFKTQNEFVMVCLAFRLQ